MPTITTDDRTQLLLEFALRSLIPPRQHERVAENTYQIRIGDHLFTAGDLVDAYDAVADAHHGTGRTFLEISTTHLSPATRELWSCWSPKLFPLTMFEGEDSWIMEVPLDNDGWDYRYGVEMIEIFDYARAAGAAYVMLIPTAPTIEGLPTFDEEAAHV